MTPAAQRPPRRPGEPAWEIAELFPEQGAWTDGQYLAIKTNRLVELDNGTIEVLPLPTRTHQLIVLFLFELLKLFVGSRGGGIVIVAPYRLRISAGRFREPDVLFLTPRQNALAKEEYAEAAELVMEVVSADDPDRDYVTKRQDYASAGVPEYWVIDRFKRLVLVLRLETGQYVEHGRFGPGQRAGSHVLNGFEVAVNEILSQGAVKDA